MENMIKYYKNLYNLYGKTPDALGWHKGNQFLRFFQLTMHWDINNNSFLDVGCGFGDFITFLDTKKTVNYKYTGIDVIKEFIAEAGKKYNSDNILFILEDFLNINTIENVDYVIASGTFNFKIEGLDGYDYIYNNMKKMFDISNKAISIDFLTDRVDYFHEHNFNSNPMKILEMAYSLSKRVILNNSIFPFEFAVTIYKDDSFSKKNTVFNNLIL